MESKLENKHRSLDSLKFVKFLCKDVAFYLGLTEVEVGIRIKDLILNMMALGKSESEYPENRAAIEEAQFYLERRYEKIAEWKRKKSGKEAPASKGEEPNIFSAKTPAPPNWQSMPRHELEKLMLAAGISAEKFFRWHEYSEGNDWLDSGGKPIKDPVAACRAFKIFTTPAGDGATGFRNWFFASKFCASNSAFIFKFNILFYVFFQGNWLF